MIDGLAGPTPPGRDDVGADLARAGGDLAVTGHRWHVPNSTTPVGDSLPANGLELSLTGAAGRPGNAVQPLIPEDRGPGTEGGVEGQDGQGLTTASPVKGTRMAFIRLDEQPRYVAVAVSCYCTRSKRPLPDHEDGL